MPLHKRILKNSAFQLVVTLVVLSAIPTLYYSRFPQEVLQTEKSSDNLTVVTQTTSSAPTTPSPKPRQLQFSAKKQKLKNTLGQSPKLQATTQKEAKNQSADKATAPLESVQAPKEPQANPTPPTPPDTPKKIQIRFAEAPRSALDELIFNHHLVAEGDSLKVGTYKAPSNARGASLNKTTTQTESPKTNPAKTDPMKEFSQKIPGLSFLSGVRMKDLSSASRENPIKLQFIHSGEDDQDYGLQLRMTPQLSDNQLTLDLEGEMNLLLESGELASSSFSFSYTLSQNELLILEFEIPNQAMNSGHMEALSNTPLRIMSDLDFLEGTTSLVMVLQSR